MERINEASSLLHEGLNQIAAQHPAKVAELRGKGLLVGLRLKISHTAVRDAARERGLLVGIAGADVVRMAPPLIVSDDDIGKALDILNSAIAAA